MKKYKNFHQDLKEDLEFARRTEEAYREIESGKGKSCSLDEFLKRLKEWTKR